MLELDSVGKVLGHNSERRRRGEFLFSHISGGKDIVTWLERDAKKVARINRYFEAVLRVRTSRLGGSYGKARLVGDPVVQLLVRFEAGYFDGDTGAGLYAVRLDDGINGRINIGARAPPVVAT